MNAFELANELDKKTGGAGNIYAQAATMLRQQQISNDQQLARLMAQAKLLAQLAKQVDDYSELVYEATKLELRIKEYEQRR